MSQVPDNPPDHDDAPSELQKETQTWSSRYARRSSPPSLDTSADMTSPGAPSPTTTDRVFPIRSVVSVDPTPTPAASRFTAGGDYFHSYSQLSESRGAPDKRRQSTESASSITPRAQQTPAPVDGSEGRSSAPQSRRQSLTGSQQEKSSARAPAPRVPARLFSDIISTFSGESGQDGGDGESSPSPVSPSAGKIISTANGSIRSVASNMSNGAGFRTHRFKHVVTEEGHAVITGRDGETLQRCEDEPIHIPGAVQGFGLLIALKEEASGALLVRIVSENSKKFIGYSPRELFALESFTDILSEEQADNLLDHIDFIRDDDASVAANGPEVFTMSIKAGGTRSRKLWCAIHVNNANPDMIICEFELEDDQINPLAPSEEDLTPGIPEDTLNSNPTEAEFIESTATSSRPLRVLRSARKRKGEAAAMEVFSIMSQVQEQLASATNLEMFLKVLVGIVKELTGFHRVMIYQFDSSFNGRVVTELVDPRATKDLYQGLNFPASDIPKQARELYKVNKVRMLYDRDQETARLVCRTLEDLEHPLDLTHSYLRAMSPIHLKYLANMAVRSSMSISINAFNELWGLISCHAYGPRGIRVSFPIRKMCRLVGDAASRNIERLSYASRLQARKLINTAPTQASPSGYIIASSDDLLALFDADFGILSIRDETKILGRLQDSSQEALAILEYLRMRKITSVTTSQDVNADFPDLRYAPGFQLIAGMLVVPLSKAGHDFIVFFRKGQIKEVKWAGNPYEKFIKEGTEGYLEPRKSFKIWRETIVGKSREWTEEEVETAAVLCLVYGKFIDVWRQKELALQNSQVTRLLLANSAHEVRTPLNAIINYLEIALEGNLDQEVRDNLTKSHSASKSLIYVINDLLDLTKTEEGASLIKGDTFDLGATLEEAAEMFAGDARRKNLSYEVTKHPGLPKMVIGDQRRVRQAISNITANAIQHTAQGGIKIEMYVASWPTEDHVEVEVAVTDTGRGMNAQKLDQLFNELEQVQSENTSVLEDAMTQGPRPSEENGEKGALGLGLAMVSRIIKNMNGQLRLKSEEGKGSRFIIQFPFDIPDFDVQDPPSRPREGSITPQQPEKDSGELTLVASSSSHNGSRHGSINSDGLSNKKSADSLNSQIQSLRSVKSDNSRRSDVDRLIEAIQEPRRLDSDMDGAGSSHSMKPLLRKSISSSNSSNDPYSPNRVRSKSLEHPVDTGAVPPHLRSLSPTAPGEQQLPFSGVPLKPIKMPQDAGVPLRPEPESGTIIGELADEPKPKEISAPNPPATQMRVLVAEDDPLNSRIVKKRLEKIGHSVHLTVNGEECAGAFGDNPRDFDVVLMDMQMPIVDGLTSTKLIRSFEKTHAGVLSPRAALNGRVPIIATSASLVEKNLQTYLDAGFDAWILKPISFDRLAELMNAIIDRDIRRDCLYQAGEWEKGGWFHCDQKSSWSVPTKPSGGSVQGVYENADGTLTTENEKKEEDRKEDEKREDKRDGVKEEKREGDKMVCADGVSSEGSAGSSTLVGS